MIALAAWTIAAADWLVTFAIHSSVALGLAWLASAALRRRAIALQETLLRWSMAAALASTTLQVAMLPGLFSSQIVLPGAHAAAQAAEVYDLFAAFESVPSAAELAPSEWSRWPWQVLVAVTAAVLAVGGLCWLAVVHSRLRRVLAERQPETDPRVLGVAAEVAMELGLKQSPHLSRSARLATPIAFGLVRPEICLPRRAAELGDASLRAMLAHEVAHLRAQDPAWMWGAAWLQALFPWQPLLVAVRRRWARLVELRCDAIAAGTATPTAVARCLLDVADWLQPRAPQSVVALGMAARPSALRERIEAALRGDPYRPTGRTASWALGAVFFSALSVVPGVESEPVAAAAIGSDAATAVPAPASPSPTMARVAALAVLVQREHEELKAEVAGLRDPAGSATSADPAWALVEARLRQLDHLRARADALLAAIALRETVTERGRP
ncbi:MAG: M56 family metallopeptidase [Planctomycetes bacterium]|nr:M56 family metallopeptidase [Planctomycetota bacterium]